MKPDSQENSSFDANAAANELRRCTSGRQVIAFRNRHTPEQRKAAFAQLNPLERGTVLLMWKFGPSRPTPGKWSSWEDGDSELTMVEREGSVYPVEKRTRGAVPRETDAGGEDPGGTERDPG